jgi:hypothetical protein
MRFLYGKKGIEFVEKDSHMHSLSGDILPLGLQQNSSFELKKRNSNAEGWCFVPFNHEKINFLIRYINSLNTCLNYYKEN